MRVIEERHIHEKEAFCIHCGSTLGYYPADIKIDGSANDVVIYIRCPVCGKLIMLEELTVEQYWEWQVKFKKWKDGV